MNLMWFRSDLRVADNPALNVASQGGHCLAVFYWTAKQWDAHDLSPIQRDLIARQLRSLEQDLAKLNIPLLIIESDCFAEIPGSLRSLCHQYSIQTVVSNLEYELNETRLTRQVETTLAEAGISYHSYHDQCSVRPGAILNQHGEMYQVFTSFKKRYFAEFDRLVRPLAAMPEACQSGSVKSDLTCLPETLHTDWAGLWPAGEDEAHERLQVFIERGLKHYKARRDLPADDGTSVLSPYLAIGAISTRQCFQALQSLNGGSIDSRQEGFVTWATELVWREFYRHFLAAHPRLCQHFPFKANTDGLAWSQDDALFQAWCRGETGYPIVDAGMRQLNQTGWMHNRLRMVCAMFLTKHLFIDWRMGERYFMQHLVDADFASNNGGWQWSASTGVDAVPYFRIFNPQRQSERFDESGDFIREFVPELASLDRRSIHNPSPEQRRKCHYPAPIVDHKRAVASTKQQFAELSSHSESSAQQALPLGEQA